jgi:predicted transcriptional regulator of viral defense system
MAAADREITALARRQHGVVAAHQLRALGVSATQVSSRARDGLLRRLHRGVYAVGEIGQKGAWLAAVLACGRGALLSYRDAAALCELRVTNRRKIDVTVPVHRRPRRGIDIHVTRRLHPHDRTVIDGIPVTSLARTLLDLAELVPYTQLQRAYEEAERLRVLDVRAIHDLLERSNGRRGVAALRSLLGYDPTAATDSRSELESRFLDLVREAGLPLPQVNTMVEGFRP